MWYSVRHTTLQEHELAFLQRSFQQPALHISHILYVHTLCGQTLETMHSYTSMGGQTVGDRQDKAALRPQSFRQADTKAKSIKGGQFPRAALRKENSLYNQIRSC